MSSLVQNNLKGYLRQDGRKGIRNLVVVAYLVECAHHVAREISTQFRNQQVHLIGFGGCYPNSYADKMMNALCTHQNVGAVLLVSLGCESFNRLRLQQTIEESGRPVKLVGIQSVGGTRKAIDEGIDFISSALEEIKSVPVVNISLSELSVGVVCGGSDATSGITSNPAVGNAFDLIIENGGTAIFENTGEMIGLEKIMSNRATTPLLADELKKAVEKAAKYYSIMGHGSFAPGNAEGGLTTLEEKSMGAYCKTGNSPVSGMIKPGDIPQKTGLYLMDIVPDGNPRFGFPNPNDSSEIAELIASGAHCVLFTTGRGSVVGSAIAPVIKVCANPETFKRMEEDMDINAGKILYNQATIKEVGQEIVQKILSLASGQQTCSEMLGHQEFVLGYKTFEPIGPSCLP
ncbi:L-fuconate dehydratase, type 2 [Arcticibacter svalbardensis MN12-7]|uniref:L-fuconate dehydratase, type 2 n=1 Tax=Arcticibacter svalbardensis MN12-7 TaxID=1150600 RepID=R9GYQ3_9SPHI|nr:UxaA family hydrolase [Arcticibacter svalbardensis]EOR96788.1 L-fuconate dehydratase, type 2 [Arcticibacter svalbardensis MN12-7]